LHNSARSPIEESDRPKQTPAGKKPTYSAPEGHEGAREYTKPGEPPSRDVITPDWAELEKKTEDGPIKPKTAPPVIDRRR
jgi:hypothetical protein